MQLAHHLGCPPRGTFLEFRIEEAERTAARALGQTNYVCVHAGARDERRRLAPPVLAGVGDALAKRGLRVLLTGSAADAPLTAVVADTMRQPSLDMAGRTDLGALAAVLENASLLVCADTGVSHLAAAVGTPSVVVFLASDPDRWAPLDRVRHRVIVAAETLDLTAAILAEADSLLDMGPSPTLAAGSRPTV